MNNEEIIKALSSVIHPEAKQNLAEGGFISDMQLNGERVTVTLRFRRPKDPFAASLKRQAEAALAKAFPGKKTLVTIEEPAPKVKEEPSRRIPGVRKVLAVASGKGGVGKSTVAAYLASALASEGSRVGLLDADIYGPSQPQLFGVDNYLPPAVNEDGMDLIVPAESMGVKVMSIAFFIDPKDALIWRGPMATNALRQLVRQTKWGELDYLLIDLPPGTGDVHLSIVHELELDGAVIVSTPQQLAVADVRRGVEMFRAEGIDVPVLGIIENMAWFTPTELPDNKYYIFGNGGARHFAESEKIDFLGDIPLVQSVMEAGEKGIPAEGLGPEVKPYYVNIARKIVDKLRN